ncbi:MAG TPA: hypothetical protein VML75_03095 [Kofleriaceae bacterium]|nr:hypothetical protein [Kofleriaceae bacterium]
MIGRLLLVALCSACAGSSQPVSNGGATTEPAVADLVLHEGPAPAELAREIHLRLGLLLEVAGAEHLTEAIAHLDAAASSGPVARRALARYRAASARLRAADVDGARQTLAALLAECTRQAGCQVEPEARRFLDVLESNALPADAAIPDVTVIVPVSTWEQPVDSLGLSHEQAALLHAFYQTRTERDRAASAAHEASGDAERDAARRRAAALGTQEEQHATALLAGAPNPLPNAAQAILFTRLLADYGNLDDIDGLKTEATLQRVIALVDAGRTLASTPDEQLRLAYLGGVYLSELGQIDAAIAALRAALAQAEARP